VYLNLVAQELEKGNGAIFLVPEIALTPQMERQFFERFGDLLALHHSKLSPKEKYNNWLDLVSGKKRVVLGARSAIFTPVKNLSLVIVDEEGESSYKQDTSPLYDTRVLCEYIQNTRGIKVVFGSATPSLRSFFKIKDEQFAYHPMKSRFNKKTLPEFHVVNLKSEFHNKNKSVFSKYLHEKMSKELSLGNQVILFVSRRGHSSFVMCRSCSEVLECKNCNISLTYHDSKRLHCHYCAYQIVMPKVCPTCQSTAIKYFGLGTQKVEEFFKKEFPDVKYGRLDTDVTRYKGALESVLKDMGDKKIQVLIGTQMIAKGLDFEDVTLTAILNPDSMVKMGDYSARERAFSLFIQIAGRAGRSEKSGNVILQTYTPENDVYEFCKKYEVDEFLAAELASRKELQFPPFYHLIQFLSSSEDVKIAEQNIEKFYIELQKVLQENVDYILYPPQTSPLEKIDRRYRFRIVLKAQFDPSIWANVFALIKSYRSKNKSRLKVIVDAENLL
jgi:primosomal protein N' (replication factor Y)